MSRDLQDEIPSLDSATTWILGTLFLASSLALYGDLSLSAFGYNVAEWLLTPVFELSESAIEVTYAHVISLAALGGVYLGTDEALEDFTDHQGMLGMGTAAVIVLTVISPEFVDLITATDTRAMLFVAVISVGFLAVEEAKTMAERGWI